MYIIDKTLLNYKNSKKKKKHREKIHKCLIVIINKYDILINTINYNKYNTDRNTCIRGKCVEGGGEGEGNKKKKPDIS